MRYKGNIENIICIEDLITKNLPYRVNKDGSAGIHTQLKEETPSRQFVKCYMVKANSHQIAVKLEFDYRYGSGELSVKDNRIWALAAALPDICSELAKMRPIYTKHKRGEMMQALDKLLE